MAMMAQHRSQFEAKRTAENTEAWIFGSGTESLASALYLIKDAKVHPPKIHVIDKHLFSERIPHRAGCSSSGYDQFAACLPVRAGLPMERLLAMLPSAQSQGQSLLDDIKSAEAKRVFTKKNIRTRFLALSNGSVSHIPTDSLHMSYKQRMALIHLFFKREKYLLQSQVRECFPESFFQCPFWAIWSAQYVPHYPALLTSTLFLTFCQIWIPTMAQRGRVQAFLTSISTSISQFKYFKLPRHHRLLSTCLSVSTDILFSPKQWR